MRRLTLCCRAPIARSEAHEGRRARLAGPFLDALKAGEAVVVGSAELLCAFIAVELPRASYERFCFGGADFNKCFLLDENDRLSELADERE